jgi:hypothetical protein
LGTPGQIELAQRLVREFAERSAIDWHPLLLELRESLRTELQLDPVERTLLHLRLSGADDKERAADER